MATPPSKDGSIAQRAGRTRLLGGPLLPWILVAIAALFFGVSVIDAADVFGPADGRPRARGSLAVYGIATTSLILSIGWLAASCRRGGRLKRGAEAAADAEHGDRLVREGELRSGIAGGQVQPFYQPIVGLPDGSLRGFEVLARWHHPRLGTLPPAEFLRLADGTGLMTALTESLLRQACRHAALMPDGLQFAINVSPSQLREPGLAERLVGIVDAAGISTRLIEIELTEDAITEGGTAVRDVVAVFQRSGMSVVLDDFGTGDASLSNLRQLKFDRIKIDRSFVQNLLTSGESRELVDAILGLAKSFDMDVTAEGIESAEVARVLSSKGCDQAQGFHFGGPMCFDDALILSVRRTAPPRRSARVEAGPPPGASARPS